MLCDVVRAGVDLFLSIRQIRNWWGWDRKRSWSWHGTVGGKAERERKSIVKHKGRGVRDKEIECDVEGAKKKGKARYTQKAGRGARSYE
jgi:hypothetical protein